MLLPHRSIVSRLRPILRKFVAVCSCVCVCSPMDAKADVISAGIALRSSHVQAWTGDVPHLYGDLLKVMG